jgi:hypothetical protein
MTDAQIQDLVRRLRGVVGVPDDVTCEQAADGLEALAHSHNALLKAITEYLECDGSSGSYDARKRLDTLHTLKQVIRAAEELLK